MRALVAVLLVAVALVSMTGMADARVVAFEEGGPVYLPATLDTQSAEQVDLMPWAPGALLAI